MDYKPNFKNQTCKLLEDNARESLGDLGFDNEFLDKHGKFEDLGVIKEETEP